MEQKLTGISFSRNQLKLLIAVTMTADHVGYMLVPVYDDPSGPWLRFCWLLYYALRLAGRLAYPLVCFFLVQGLRHTHDRGKYLLRLVVFALLSEVPFDLAINGSLIDWTGQNVLFTLSIGLLMLFALERVQKAGTLAIRLPAGILAVLAAMLLAWLLKTDYSYWGILLLLLFYLGNIQKGQRFWIMVLLCACEDVLEIAAVASLFFTDRYDADKNKGKPLFGRYFFYLFYPVHLLVILAVGEGIALLI